MGITASITPAQSLNRLRSRADFQRNPARAIGRRLFWRLRWAVTSSPWRLRLGDELSILAPRGGAGALIYYLGYSEPETARFITSYLQAGMTFWDVGAHIGEYSLIAAKRVGTTGRVEAFEPQPSIFELLERNVSINNVSSITLHREAVSDECGVAKLFLSSEPSMSHLGRQTAGGPTVSVSTISLDHFVRASERRPDLVKVDVEGAEKLVLHGACSILQFPPAIAPVWVMEYSPDNCAKSGYDASDLVDQFGRHGYKTFWLSATGELITTERAVPWSSSGNFVATKRELKQ
jgi:FkbM family methyltransferase